MTATLLPAIIQIAEQAGEAILAIYGRDQADFNISAKSDDSPLTAADMAAHRLIVAELAKLTPELPILSEEAADISWDIRKSWQRYWLVDPLDGTKEFIKRNGEFTVNIALIDNGEPVLGVVHAPVLAKTYYAAKGEGAFLKHAGNVRPIKVNQASRDQLVKVVGSRSHPSPDLAGYLAQFDQHEMVPVGSSLKFCLVADGTADVYPRFGPTMAWDTGAGHIVATEAGATVSFDGISGKVYQREQLLNPNFMVSALVQATGD
ncbi:3'(2'),5'-bisphosphate nucleotidase CysQ [Arsukibacterium indicum]|uniref:3'(2'),5'-bisphosphate nucleotidase CysQ n=1 Tax=Arsukibacterium indicum TaxID=2848612 RepID=A0ABS6MNP4_9GAMM|nr:3'(2'),5'-bisphosphate nucleotidase CysQ [Arsukibacterium indicum]MBV2130432.1 3'(2'),5'-bisphosphate nucleotidase CysQ [Arsukibacterium indicum]